jgi:subtilisin family serine protease
VLGGLALTLVALAVAPGGASAAGRPDVTDRYIVVLRADASDASVDRARSKARVAGGDVDRVYRKAVRGFAGRLSKKALADVRADPAVAFVERDAVLSIDTTQNGATWGLDRVDQRARPLSTTYTYEATGAGVTAYVIDTGVRTTHQEFAGRATSGFDSVDGLPADDCNGHGTHVAGTIGGTTYGVAKAVSIVAVRVLNCSGSGSTSGVIAGIDYVTQAHAAGRPAVANMSLGGGVSAALDQAVRNSIADGVTYAIAAGNSNANACNGSPARVAEALTVGATTTTDARSSFSNFGTCLDLFAPGSGITSAWSTSNSATNTISGTSMATPHVAGVAALRLQETPSATPAAVADTIRNNATVGVVTGPGTGSPNRLLYALASTSPPPPPPPPPPAGCAAVSYSGSLSGTGDADIHPNGSSYSSTTSGVHKGCLKGPAGTDFDLYLDKWNGTSWTIVARSIGVTATETITYNGTPGTYRWRVLSYSGSGAYTFELTRPT